MNKLLPFVKLDFITAKHYLNGKYLLIYAAVTMLLTMQSDNLLSSVGVGLMIGTLNIAYPFVIGEKSGMDALYISLAVSRRTVVLGRYIFSLLLDVCAVLCALLLSLAGGAVMPGRDFGGGPGTFAGFLVLGAFFLLVQAIQLPIFFRLGYAKGKFVSIVPFALIMAAVGAVVGLRDFSGNPADPAAIPSFFLWASRNALTIQAAVCLAILAAFFASYRLSLVFYKKRDF
jgi:hypothetical protein